MKKTIIALSIATIAFGGIYLFNNKSVLKIIEYKKAEQKNIQIKEREKRRKIAELEIKKIQEAERKRKEYEANRNFEEEISVYTPIVDNILTFENIKELNVKNTRFKKFINNYDLSHFKGVHFFEKVNHRVFKVASSDSYEKFFSKMEDRELLSGIIFPHIDNKNSYSMKKLKCKEEKYRGMNRSTDFKCDTHNLLISMRKLDNNSLEFTIRYNEMLPHKSYIQEIKINSIGEMLVIDPYRDEFGNIREYKKRMYAID